MGAKIPTTISENTVENLLSIYVSRQDVENLRKKSIKKILQRFKWEIMVYKIRPIYKENVVIVTEYI